MTTSDRWRRLEDLYHAALEREAPARAAFLYEACGHDEELRREIEALLAYDTTADRFMASSPLESLPGGPVHDAKLNAGQQFGPYRIVSFIGAGGMGDVYRAHDVKLGRDVAIKILPDVFAEDSHRRARFEREGRLLASLNHPHIAAIYGFEDRDSLHGLVLELVEGETLAERIGEGALPLSEALTVARQIADALQAAHATGVVHRDLKPANIAIRRDGTVKVLDFGLAKGIAEVAAEGPTGTPTLANSGAGLIAGTVGYMSPEQASGKPAEARADIWAFGCVLWTMLTGRPPFARDTVSATLSAVLDAAPDWRTLPPGLPAAVTGLLASCLQKDPARRPSTIAAARTALDAALAPSAEDAAAAAPRLRRRGLTAAVTGVFAVLTVAAVIFVAAARPGRAIAFTQLTNFTDAAVAPAIAPDGRTIAFLRGNRTFLTSGAIYVKKLPNGEAVRLIDDGRTKYGLTFSPDGSILAYTVAATGGWSTYQVPVTGGTPTTLLTNAAGLMWLDPQRFVFSEIKRGFHMGTVTAGPSRAGHREVYFPQHERSMVHYSYPSPDKRWALLVEMDYRPVWEPCRLIPLDGSSRGNFVGPRGKCSSAGWSPDGRWMYFTVEIAERSHVWRQRFPDGEPEQLTFDPTQEEGIAVAPDGSLITSIGTERSVIWIHDSQGDHPLSSEGDVLGRIGSFSWPSFSADGTRLRYLRRQSPGVAAELWQTEIATGKNEPMLPGVGMAQYDIARDGTQVVFMTEPPNRPTELWVAPLDRRRPPVRIASNGENTPSFGPAGEVLFRFTDGTLNYLGRMKADGSGREKVVPYPIGTIQSVSPDRRWVIAITPWLDGRPGTASMAIPTTGGSPRTICPSFCNNAWSLDGQRLYLGFDRTSPQDSIRMVALPVLPDTGLPDIPRDGFQSLAQATAIPGHWVVPGFLLIVPGPDRDTYAYVRTTVNRNLYRLSFD